MRVVLLYILLCFAFVGRGQNLIPNGDFELTYTYPKVTLRIDTLVPNWFTAYSSPDIFHIMPDSLPNAYQERSIPENQFGEQPAYSGHGYAGLFTHTVGFTIHGNGAREWIGVRLTDTLRKNNTYCFTMHISLAESSDYANDRIGIYFSHDSIFNDLGIPVPFPTDTENISYTYNQFYSNMTEWDTVNLTYEAKGGEKYLYIGNFFPDTLVNWIHAGDNESIGSAYYYIDNISLIKCAPTTLNEKPISPIKAYPNPSNGVFTIENTKPIKQLKIYNSYGQLEYTESPSSTKITVDLTHLPAGMYLCNIDNSIIKLIKE